MSLLKKMAAEAIGTFVLVFFAVGTAVVSNCDWVATALAFGLVIVAMAYTVGNISGCHINPAVSFGVFLSQKLTGKKDFGLKEFGAYCLAQVIGACLGALALYAVVMGMDFPIEIWGTNGVGAFGGEDATAINYIASIVAEIILTFVFVYVILVVCNNPKTQKKAGILIGATLTLVHLVGIGMTGTSVNPARSIGTALMQAAFGGGTEALAQIWVFIVAPLAGAAVAALMYKFFHKNEAADTGTAPAVEEPKTDGTTENV